VKSKTLFNICILKMPEFPFFSRAFKDALDHGASAHTGIIITIEKFSAWFQWMSLVNPAPDNKVDSFCM